MKFASATALKRLLRSASQVAELNGYALAMVVTGISADEDIAEQVIALAPELEAEIEGAGGVDAAATIADTSEPAGDIAPGDVSATNSDSGSDAAVNTHTDSDGDADGENGSEAPPAVAPEVVTPASAKAGRKKSKTSKERQNGQ